MSVFRNILVGLDLIHCPRTKDDPLGLIAETVVARAILKAKKNDARLLFFAALNIPEEAFHSLPPKQGQQVKQSFYDWAHSTLAAITERARKEGVEADYDLVQGRGWLEMTKRVLRDKHDLVFVGTRNLTGWRRVLFGNTAMKLIRICPCPVWVTRPSQNRTSLNMLIATDLKPGSEDYLRTGIALALQFEGSVHVLHVVEYPLDRIWCTGQHDPVAENYHREVRDAASAVLQQQLEATAYKNLGSRLQVHLVEGAGLPDVAIRLALQQYEINLLVMGTMARSGLPAVVMGNSAERLLPEVQCSLLALKPSNFVSPVHL